MSTIQVLLFFHLLGAFMIAAGVGLSLVIYLALRGAQRTSTIVALLGVVSKVRLLAAPGAVLAVGFGSLLVTQAGFKYSEAWMSAAYLGVLVGVALGPRLLGRSERRWEALAAQELAAGREDSPTLRAAFAGPGRAAGEYVQAALVLVFLALMVFKPGH